MTHGWQPWCGSKSSRGHRDWVEPGAAAVADRCVGWLRWASVVHPRAYVAPGSRSARGPSSSRERSSSPTPSSAGTRSSTRRAASITTTSSATSPTSLPATPGRRRPVGTGSLIGLGAVLLPGRSVGSWSTVERGRRGRARRGRPDCRQGRACTLRGTAIADLLTQRVPGRMFNRWSDTRGRSGQRASPPAADDQVTQNIIERISS